MAEQDQEFKVVDRRRLLLGEDEPSESSQAEEKPAEQEDRVDRLVEEMQQKEPTDQKTRSETEQEGQPRGSDAVTSPQAGADIMIAVKLCIKILADNAYFLLGMVRHPETGQVYLEPGQAKIAIDCLEAIFEKVSDQFNALDKREIRALISDLKMNFVSRCQRGKVVS